MKKFRKLFENEDGQALIMVSLLMVVILGFAALTIDIGVAYTSKSKLQSAADAAALAGAGVPSYKVEVALDVAKANNVESGVEGASVLVNSNPVSGKSETTQRNYTAEEIAAIKVELENKSNQDLIDLADVKEVEEGLGTTTTPGSRTSDDFNSKSDAELIQLAKDNSLASMLTSNTSQEYTGEASTEFIRLQGLSLTDLATEAISVDSTLDDNSNYINKGVVKEQFKNEVIEKVLTAKKYVKTNVTNYSVPSNKNKKESLIKAIVDKINVNESVNVTTINNKTTLIQALIEKEKEEIITEGKMLGDSSRVRVDITKDVPFSFARVLNLSGTKVSVHAVAEKISWAGDALPFINLDGDAEKSVKGQPLSAWNKTGPGDKERISNDDLIISANSIQVNYQDGSIEFKKGKVMSAIKEPLQKIAVEGNVVYIFSIKKDEMLNYQKGHSKELKNGDKIPLKDIVLLECEVTETWGGDGSGVINLKFLESYSWNCSEFLSSFGESPDDMVKLVE